MNHSLHKSTHGVNLRYRLGGSLFDLRRLNTRIRTLERLIMEALFTDDCAVITNSEHELQTIISRSAKVSHLFGLTISLNKTKVMHQPAPGSTETSPSINIDGTQQKSVNHFRYPGSGMSSDGTLEGR